MFLLHPTNFTAITIKPRIGVEICALGDDLHTLVLGIDDHNDTFNNITIVVLLNSKDQINLERMKIEVCITDHLCAIYDGLDIIRGSDAKNSVGVGVGKYQTTIGTGSASASPVFKNFAPRAASLGEEINELRTLLLNYYRAASLCWSTLQEINSSGFSLEP
jgi:hypothetical protein